MNAQMITSDGMALQTGKQYREKAKKRQEAWIKKMHKSGYQQISAFLPGDVVRLLKAKAEKDNLSMTKELEKVLREYFRIPDNYEVTNANEYLLVHSDNEDDVLAGIKARQDQGEKYQDLRADICHWIDQKKNEGILLDEIAYALDRAGIKPQKKEFWDKNAVWQTHKRFFSK
jgi:hypothetical protein